MADGDQGDLANKDGGAAAAADGANKDAKADASADAGKAAALAGDKTAAEAAGDKAPDKTAGELSKAAPVDYAKVIGEVPLPEGLALDPERAKQGTEVFAKHNLSAEAVKDLVSLYAQQQKAGADGNAKAFADQVTGWRTDAEKASTPEERGQAKDAALKVFAKDDLAVLESFGITNRLGFIKSMAKIGQAIKDDQFVPGNAGSSNGAADARNLYPNSTMNP